MSVYFNSFIADKEEDLKKIFYDIVTKYTEKADNVFVMMIKQRMDRV